MISCLSVIVYYSRLNHKLCSQHWTMRDTQLKCFVNAWILYDLFWRLNLETMKLFCTASITHNRAWKTGSCGFHFREAFLFLSFSKTNIFFNENICIFRRWMRGIIPIWILFRLKLIRIVEREVRVVNV